MNDVKDAMEDIIYDVMMSQFIPNSSISYLGTHTEWPYTIYTDSTNGFYQCEIETSSK